MPAGPRTGRPRSAWVKAAVADVAWVEPVVSTQSACSERLMPKRIPVPEPTTRSRVTDVDDPKAVILATTLVGRVVVLGWKTNHSPTSRAVKVAVAEVNVVVPLPTPSV